MMNITYGLMLLFVFWTLLHIGTALRVYYKTQGIKMFPVIDMILTFSWAALGTFFFYNMI